MYLIKQSDGFYKIDFDPKKIYSHYDKYIGVSKLNGHTFDITINQYHIRMIMAYPKLKKRQEYRKQKERIKNHILP